MAIELKSHWAKKLFHYALVFAAAVAFALPAVSHGQANHYLYVFNPGPLISVYDLDNNFNLVKRIQAGTAGNMPLGGIASAVGNMLYVSYNGCTGIGCPPSMMKYNLLTDQVVWTKSYAGVDSHSITPDGRRIYMPLGGSSAWQIIDTATGDVVGSIDIGYTPTAHNTIVSNNGAHVYMGSINAPYLVKANTSDNSIVQRIGPTLNSSVRPFTIDSQERWAFINVNGILGFQVGDIATGNILYTVPVSGFSTSQCTPASNCTHGISLSPDGSEIYLADRFNNHVHVFDVTGLPSSPPRQVADIPLNHPFCPCTDRGVTHSRDGRFVVVGASGDVINTATRQIVGYIPDLGTTKMSIEVDFKDGLVSFTPLSRSGVGYSSSVSPPPAPLIDRYYQSILGRAGDAGGVAFWQSEVARLSGLGADPTEAFIAMAVAFYSSAEFAARGLSDTAFVDSLYATFFNRAADAPGRSFWAGQINLGLSREMVMYAFLFSSEFASFMAQNVGSTPSRAEVYTVIDFYRGAFGRLPDSGGLTFWVNQFRSAQCSNNPTALVYDAVIAIAGGFFDSFEYRFSSPAKTNKNHISNFYNAFMRRGADVAGYVFWVNQLDAGANFDAVRKTDFIDSPEFALRVQQIVAAGCTTLML